MIANNGVPAESYPLQVCHGDCDIDADCAVGLYCYQRSSNSGFVPGCEGSTDGDNDYCISTIKPISSSVYLSDVGDNGVPGDAFPLQECQGDCDGDSDCAPGLLCLDRTGIQPIPGCLGDGTSGKDYCYVPWTTGETLTIVGDNNNPISVFPLKACQGDCDSDNDCAVSSPGTSSNHTSLRLSHYCLWLIILLV